MIWLSTFTRTPQRLPGGPLADELLDDSGMTRVSFETDCPTFLFVTGIHRVLVELQLFHLEAFDTLPPLLRRITQTVPAADLEELIWMHPFFDMPFRHSHVEGTVGPFFSVRKQES